MHPPQTVNNGPVEKQHIFSSWKLELFGDLGGQGKMCTNKIHQMCPGKVQVTLYNVECKHGISVLIIAGVLLSILSCREMGQVVYLQERLWAIYKCSLEQEAYDGLLCLRRSTLVLYFVTTLHAYLITFLMT